MTRILPPQPNLNHLKNEAKALSKSHKKGQASACKTLRLLKRFGGQTDEQVLAADDLALHEAQFALAMDYGFKSWDDLREHVLSLAPRAESENKPHAGAFLLENSPAGLNNTNRFGTGLRMLLNYCGAGCNYSTIMGDTGLAFILQSDTKHTAWGKPVDQLDIGWWPLDPWGCLMRLNFLGRTVGIELRVFQANLDEYRANRAEYYHRNFHSIVTDTLNSGRPVYTIVGAHYLVTGYDNGEPPVLGQLCCVGKHKIERLESYPWIMVVPGELTKAIDRGQADIEALGFAIAVARDRLGKLAPANKLSGQKSFSLWGQLLRDPEHWGAHFYHANVIGHLRMCRESAGLYLRAMAQRHKPAAALHLATAATVYENVLEALSHADTTKETMSSPEGREELAEMVDKIAALEVTAADEMEKALPVIK